MSHLKQFPGSLHANVNQWLAYIEALHPKSIVMGLERVRTVVERLNFAPSFVTITIAGTNGKGSTCAMLESIYLKAGYRVGCYTSPHLIRYNERVRVDRRDITDDELCQAFAAVELVRGETALTYFEFGTLAAMWHFQKSNLDVAILEVGMGGRLDAVNVFNSDCAIVTGVDLDHMEYLGDNREKIGFEKAGVFRANRPAICGDDDPPTSLLDYANSLNANLQLIHRDFDLQDTSAGLRYSHEERHVALDKLGLQGDFQRNNAASALCAVDSLMARLPVNVSDITSALSSVELMGRYQRLYDHPEVVVDVAHNPQAARSLRNNLQISPCGGRTIAVFAMLADKDIEGVIREVLPCFSAWYLADIHNIRGAKAADISDKLLKLAPESVILTYDSIAHALRAAYKGADKNDRIIVFGSFYTVADAIDNRALLSD